MKSTWVKFNNANGSEQQQQCQITCGYADSATGGTERIDGEGKPFDVYFEIVGDTVFVRQGMRKCFDCPAIKAHFGME